MINQRSPYVVGSLNSTATANEHITMDAKTVAS